MAKFCSNCGNKLGDYDSFCSSCGSNQINLDDSNQEVKKNKSKIVAAILYMCVAPFSIGDLYLGYKKKFINQIIRLGIIVIFVANSKYVTLIPILSIIFTILSFWVFFVQFANIIKGFRILIGNIKTDAYGIDLK